MTLDGYKGGFIMSAALINLLITYLPYIVEVLFAVLSTVIAVKLLPYLRSKLSQSDLNNIEKQLGIVMDWAEVFVASAQRLDRSGKLNDLTKKEYVMEKLMEKIKELNYNFTEEQLDNIRRSVVYALEQTEEIIADTADSLKKEKKNGKTKSNK